jgi:hypothetical protein
MKGRDREHSDAANDDGPGDSEVATRAGNQTKQRNENRRARRQSENRTTDQSCGRVAGPPALQDACPRTHTRRSTQTTIRDLRECVATQTCVVVRDECVVGSEACMGDIPATMRRRQRPTCTRSNDQVVRGCVVVLVQHCRNM